MYDIIIIGGGPAGVSAALYTVRAGLRTLVIENGANALAKAHRISNYYGADMPGADLYQQGLQQAQQTGAQVKHDEVLKVEYTGGFTVYCKDEILETKTVILATGTKNITLKADGLSRLEGKGVSYCATCDGFFYRKKNIAVLGSGAFAIHEAAYLKHLAASLTVLTNGESSNAVKAAGFTADERVITSINGNDKLESITFSGGAQAAFDGLFIALGTAGSTDIARSIGAETDGRFIKTDNNGATNVPGLFAAGDCTGGLLQVAKAVYEGAAAGNAVIKYIRSQTNN